MCYSPWGSEELDMTWKGRLPLFNWNPINPKGKTEKTFRLQQVGGPSLFHQPITPHSSSWGTPGKPRTQRMLPLLFYRWGKDAGNETRALDGLLDGSGIFLSLCLSSGDKGKVSAEKEGVFPRLDLPLLGAMKPGAWGARAAPNTPSRAWWPLALYRPACGFSSSTARGKVDQGFPLSHTMRMEVREFTGGLVVRIHCLGPGSIPGWGELRTHKPCSVAKRERERETTYKHHCQR